jgi:ferric-dicitrate binding protein FerR (iron transport regulator)
MTDAELKTLIQDCAAGDISPAQHQQLQAELKASPHARAAFREFMDVEACLRTWASDGGDSRTSTVGVRRASVWGGNDGRGRPSYGVAVAASVAVFLLIAVSWWFWPTASNQPEPITEEPNRATVNRVAYVGTFGQQQDCVWNSSSNATPGIRFSTERLSLVSGVAELKLDSGTNLVLEGPCELEVVGVDAAQLLAGNLVVHVTELSDGFSLKTPDATIINEGIEYAVSLDDDATEIHAFDGSVIWEPVAGGEAAAPERIESGEARRYPRSKPLGGARIPLGGRLFVRRIEATVREASGDDLLAYDGFENLAGRIQRGRSGFGWSDGWTLGRGGAGKHGDIVDAPHDTVFGIQRSARRLLRLSDGAAIVREFETPLPLETGDVYYASFLLKRSARDNSTDNSSGQFFELSLVNDGDRRGHRSRKWFTFGITSEGQPFIKSVGSISTTASPIEVEATHFCVAKILVTQEQVHTFLRIYRTSEIVETQEPTAWTTVGSTGPCDFSLSGVRLSVAAAAEYDVDELKIGKTWQAVLQSTD